jgi:oligosaccharide repeat unit polymerase
VFLATSAIFCALEDWGLEQAAIMIFICGVAFVIYIDARHQIRSLFSPSAVFWISVVYTILLNPGLEPEYLDALPSEVTTRAAFMVALCLFAAVLGAEVGKRGRFRFMDIGRLSPTFHSGSVLLFVWLIFLAELLRRLYYVGWDLHELIGDMLQGRSGAVRYGRGQFGDERVFVEPIAIVARWLPVLVALFWAKNRDVLLRTIAAVPGVFILISAFFGGTRGELAMPLVGFFVVMLISSSERSARRYLVAAILVACLISPLMDLMVQYRGVGWTKGVEVTEYISNPLSAKRDSNFEAFCDLVKVVPDHQPFMSATDLYFFMAITPIPRVLWPSKPYMSQEYLGDARPSYSSVSIVGDFYLYGGWIHVLLGGFVLGIFIGALQSIADKAVKRPESTIFYVLMLVTLASTLRALWSFIAFVVLQISFFLIMLALGGVQRLFSGRAYQGSAVASRT